MTRLNIGHFVLCFLLSFPHSEILEPMSGLIYTRMFFFFFFFFYPYLPTMLSMFVTEGKSKCLWYGELKGMMTEAVLCSARNIYGLKQFGDICLQVWVNLNVSRTVPIYSLDKG